MRLFIAEKPSVGMEIAKALGGEIVRGEGYVEVGRDAVTWAVGHLIGQAKPEAYGEQYEKWDAAVLPIIPSEWKMEPNPKTAAQLRVVGRLLKKASLVVNCGDSAREGQMIVDELLDYFGYQGPAQRLWLQEMNLPAIRKALAKMKDNAAYGKLYLSALARSRADWLMGMNLTRGYTWAWRSKGNDAVLHIGRVQTPTLCLIVARDLEIENFVPKAYFVLRANVAHKNGTFVATWMPPEKADFLDASGRVLDRAIVDRIAKKVSGQAATVASCETTPKAVSPPLPFSLGDLQKAANKLLGLSPSQTLEIAQALYEKHKLTTYPRTDYSHLPEDEHGMGPAIIQAARSNFGADWDFVGEPDFSIRSAAWDNSKIGDHHGIRPTLVKNYDLSQLSRTELALYRLVVRNFLAQFYPHYRYSSTTAIVECQDERFKAQGTVPTDPGWKVLFPADGESANKADGETQNLPKMAGGDPCRIPETNVEAMKTSPPPRYDGEKIIDAMEKAHLHVTDARVKAMLKERGIGTPATRAAIVDNLIAREYVAEVKEGRKKVYISTAKGRLLYRAVPDQLRRPDLTAYFEELLAQVEQGALSPEDFMAQQTHYITRLIAAVKDGSVAASMPSLADCAPPERASKKGRGAVATAATPSRSTSTKSNGAPKAAPKDAGAGGKTCPKCASPMVKRNGAKGEFWGCKGYPSCRHTEQVNGAAPKAAPPKPRPAIVDDEFPI